MEVITEDLIVVLDELALKSAIFVAKGIGKDITFQIGVRRPDLIKGEVFIGLMNNEVNPILKAAEMELFEYMKNSGDGQALTALLNKIMNLSTTGAEDSYANELLENIKHEAFLNLYKNMHGKSHFSKKDYWDNTIPNVFLVPDSINPSVIENNGGRLGYNKSVQKIKDISTDWGLVCSKRFPSELEKSLMCLYN